MLLLVTESPRSALKPIWVPRISWFEDWAWIQIVPTGSSKTPGFATDRHIALRKLLPSKFCAELSVWSTPFDFRPLGNYGAPIVLAPIVLDLGTEEDL